MDKYCKRLIEVDLPIKRISEHARKEKDMRRGHVPLIHIWPATRPTSACRSVICASLWLDPKNINCPQYYRDIVSNEIKKFAILATSKKELAEICSEESWKRYLNFSRNEINTSNKDDLKLLRTILLDFIADFASWKAAVQTDFLNTARNITQASHNALEGSSNTKPLVVDTFSGGGAIPLEGLRIGADSFASDLNPVAVLINKTILEYIPKYGRRLAKDVKSWINWIEQKAQDELKTFYPYDQDGSIPIAYISARTITCEGPGCGIEIPLIRSLWIVKKKKKSVALKIIIRPKKKIIEFEIIENANPKEVGEGTIRRSSATCPCCEFTTQRKSVRKQIKNKNGGAANAQLICVATIHPDKKGRSYRTPIKSDLDAIIKSVDQLKYLRLKNNVPLSIIPEEPTPIGGGKGAGRAFTQRNYGLDKYEFAFTPRQLLSLTTINKLTKKYCEKINKNDDKEYYKAIRTVLALTFDKMVDMNSALCVWQTHAEIPAHVFGRWAWPTVWDFAEANPLSKSSGSPTSSGSRTIAAINFLVEGNYAPGRVEIADATNHPLPDNCAHLFGIDPPYYDAIPYADISDFFYVWLKRSTGDLYEDLFKSELTDKKNECIVDDAIGKDNSFFQKYMQKALLEGKRILSSNGIGFVVFAHKTTAGWEAQLKSIIDAGWVITSSWPIDTEMGSRLRAKGSAALASSIHLVCRPRENPDGTLIENNIGDWRDVLSELPKRIHDWMPRLADEGVVGADAIFSCIGPALEIFSRYSSVEKASGEKVELREYLEQVWAAVAREALNMIFEGADVSGFEEDARLTAMWLWTLRTNIANGVDAEDDEGKTQSITGYTLEYDAARKIAQGLGAHLEDLKYLVEIKGDTATLLSANSRVSYLFGKDTDEIPKGQKKKPNKQMALFEDDIKQIEEQPGGLSSKLAGKPGITILDKLHQTMLLFGAGRGEALKRFLVEDGVGNNSMYWRLAQSLSALYPSGTDEKRWVDGVLARKKSLGF